MVLADVPAPLPVGTRLFGALHRRDHPGLPVSGNRSRLLGRVVGAVDGVSAEPPAMPLSNIIAVVSL